MPCLTVNNVAYFHSSRGSRDVRVNVDSLSAFLEQGLVLHQSKLVSRYRHCVFSFLTDVVVSRAYIEIAPGTTTAQCRQGCV